MTDITGKSLIAGTWVTPGGTEFHSFNPYTKSAFNSFTSCGGAEIETAMTAATEAYHQMRQMDGSTRPDEEKGSLQVIRAR